MDVRSANWADPQGQAAPLSIERTATITHATIGAINVMATSVKPTRRLLPKAAEGYITKLFEENNIA